ncbi:MAG: hydrogenase expression/formation protein HypE [bacterium]|jgi:hydrogenase expression/formation protein HypE|nr:hydrogenase expression/formation protein HypE [candidate division KSB1 bacterium]MDH7558705.1 hydrogenase expression/formation protein HypE [bacterium]
MDEVIRLAHGSGGQLTHALIREVFLPHFHNPALAALNDSALLQLSGSRAALTTDSYVVQPIFFPGGDIGRLAISGTVNDLSAQGARPVAISAAFIIEEGLRVDELQRVLASMAAAANEAGVAVVAGDTKVVAAGAADKLFITTAGVGTLLVEEPPTGSGARAGDAVIVTGTIGDHGMAVMAARAGLSLQGALHSDVAPLNHLVEGLFACGVEVHAMRDPTRGGVATTLNEIAQASGVEIVIEEERIPVADEVKGACELLGFDPLYVANEGKMIVFVPAAHAEQAISYFHSHPLGRKAAIIGEVVKESQGRVLLRTAIGGHRILDMLVGEQLPRIC